MVEIDTLKIREISKDAKQLASDYLEHVDKVFNRVGNMSRDTGEWVGDSALKYSIMANSDSAQYKRFANVLRSYANHLDKVANAIEVLCVEVKKK